MVGRLVGWLAVRLLGWWFTGSLGGSKGTRPRGAVHCWGSCVVMVNLWFCGREQMEAKGGGLEWSHHAPVGCWCLVFVIPIHIVFPPILRVFVVFVSCVFLPLFVLYAFLVTARNWHESTFIAQYTHTCHSSAHTHTRTHTHSGGRNYSNR